MTAKPSRRNDDDDDFSDVSHASDVGSDEADNELNDLNINKYTAAGDIANKALAAVVEAAVAGTTVLALASLGDAKIIDLAKSVFTKDKKMRKGIAFPTCVSPAGILCSLSPLPSDPEAKITLAVGDLVRIELGAHIDGYIAQVAHTIVVGASKDAPITGRKADVLQAAHTAAEASLRLIKPGKTIGEFADGIARIVGEFDCKPIENIVTTQVLRNVLDGPKQIVLNSTEPLRKDVRETTFEQGEVYSVNLLISTSATGKTKQSDARTTVFKRNADQSYQLKMKTSRAVFSQIIKEFGTMAFTLRQFDDENKARMGVVECSRSHLVMPYPIMHEKDEGGDVVHVEFTVMLLANGPVKVSGVVWDQGLVVSEKKPSEETVALLNSTARTSSKKKKSKAAKAAMAAAASTEEVKA